MNKIVRLFGCVILILAIISYWVQPNILFVSLPVCVLSLMIGRKKYKAAAIILFLIIIGLMSLLVTKHLGGPFGPPELTYVKYLAKGKYVAESKTIELVETLGFRGPLDQIHYPDQISLSQFIAVWVLNDSSLIKHDLKSIVFTSDFKKWLKVTGWKFDRISDGNDYTLWLSRTNRINLGEKWYRPKFEYTMALPKSPFYKAELEFLRSKLPTDIVPTGGLPNIVPVTGSKVLLEMPKGMVRATSPPTAKKSFGIDYERLKIPVENEPSISLEILSWPWRSEIFINISRLILWNPFMWFVGVLSAIFADKLKDMISGKLWKESTQEEIPAKAS